MPHNRNRSSTTGQRTIRRSVSRRQDAFRLRHGSSLKFDELERILLAAMAPTVVANIVFIEATANRKVDVKASHEVENLKAVVNVLQDSKRHLAASHQLLTRGPPTSILREVVPSDSDDMRAVMTLLWTVS